MSGPSHFVSTTALYSGRPLIRIWQVLLVSLFLLFSAEELVQMRCCWRSDSACCSQAHSSNRQLIKELSWLKEQLRNGVMEVYLFLATDRLWAGYYLSCYCQNVQRGVCPSMASVSDSKNAPCTGTLCPPGSSCLLPLRPTADKCILKWLLHNKLQHLCVVSIAWYL